MFHQLRQRLSALISPAVSQETYQTLNAQVAAMNRVMGVIEFSPDGTILSVNENFLKVVGYSANQVIGQHHRMFVQPDYAQSREYQQFWLKLARGEFDQGRYQRVGKDQRNIWLEASYNPVFDHTGKVVKIVKFATDITQQRIKELDVDGQLTAIRRSQAVIELSPDGHVLAANALFLQVVGYTMDEIRGQHHRMFVDHATAQSESYRAFWQKLSKGDFFTGRFKRINKQGKEIWLEASYNPILDDAGNVYKIVKFAADITSQVALEKEAENLAKVTYKTNNTVIITDVNGLITFVNPSFTELTGYTSQEVMGKAPGQLLQGKLTDAATVARMRAHIAAKRPFVEEVLNYTKQGQPFWVSLAVNPIFDEAGQCVNFISVQTDITEAKNKQIELNMRLDAISRSTCVIEFTPQGEVTFINENFCQLTEYAAHELIGQHHRGLVPAEDRNSAAYQQFWHKLGRGEFDKGIYRRITKSGKTIWLQASYNPIIDADGRVTKIVKFAADITEQHEANAALARAVTESQAVIEQAQAGALTARVSLAQKQGPIAQMCAGINTLIENTSQLVMRVSTSSQNMNAVATEISSGNNDLSIRTHAQQENLSLTASRMKELAVTVKQNADNAKQANQLALTASGVAIKGGEVVNDVVSTMRAINDSAKKIEDIISVIDGIAFQTNILALNAAVEAARAGEQGRGFAVVAGEVGNLAQRSASAAKEIKALITDSVNKTSDGTKLVENAGNTMQEVVHSVKRVADIISEITAASHAQTTGIDQVNQAVASMGATTQQNAALVQEASAAAQALLDQANQLSDAISQFEVGDVAQQSSFGLAA